MIAPITSAEMIFSRSATANICAIFFRLPYASAMLRAADEEIPKSLLGAMRSRLARLLDSVSD